MTPCAVTRGQVLVVEDEGLIALDLKRRLNRLGYAVPGIAETADQAVRMAADHLPDLILMDISLKGARDGIDAASELRRRMDVPIVFLTAHTDPRTLQRAVCTEPSGFIVKPFSPADLRAQIELAQARQLRARKLMRPPPHRSQLLKTSIETSAIAHDFGNLMTLILGNAELLLASGAGEPAEQIWRASQLATMLSRQLLPGAGTRSGVPAALDLNAALASSRRLIQQAAGPRCRLVFSLCEEPVCVAAHEDQLTRIWLNLALNAGAAMKGGGELRISTRKVAHSLAELSIADDGPGMSPSTLERIFDPFFTGNPSSGTGLGLTIVRGLTDQLGGTISVESMPGRGTSFHVLLPLMDAGADRKGASAEPAPQSSTVVLVEDQLQVRTLLEKNLRLTGFDVAGVAAASEAFALLESRDTPADLLVTDISLPDMNGVELAEECLRRSLVSRVLFISGYAGMPALGRSQLFRERTAFLPKPFTVSELREKVTSLLNTGTANTQ